MAKIDWTLTPRDVARFLAQVETRGPTECWPWRGGIKGGAYGGFRLPFSQPTVAAHRVMFKIVHGAEALESFEVIRHTCDNPPCVNPAHLIGGTSSDNRLDCTRKKRHNPQRGERHHQSKLTWGAVRDIRKRAAAGGVYHYQLAAEYGVSSAAIHMLLANKTWKEPT